MDVAAVWPMMLGWMVNSMVNGNMEANIFSDQKDECVRPNRKLCEEIPFQITFVQLWL